MARATPTIVGFAVSGATSGNSISFAKSALPTLVAGDYLVAALRGSTSTTSSDYTATGFARLSEAITVASGGRLVGCYGHVVTTATAEPATYTFTYTGTSGRQSGVLLVVRDVDTTAPVSGATPITPNYWSGAAFATSVGSLILACAANEVVSPNAAEPTTVDPDYSPVALASSSTGTGATRTVIWVGSRTADSTTAPSAQSTTWASTSALAYWSISLQGVDRTQQTGVPIRTGSGAAARLTVLTAGNARANPAHARMYLPGFKTVTAALAKQGATMGHRGASLTPGLAEMSERSYDYSVMRGYGILEFSTNRTSDGVWVGVHDASINRTSETTGLPNVQAMTRAQIAAQSNSLNNGGITQPYYDLIPFLDKYTRTHVVMVDPKASVSQVSEFLNLCDAHGGPTKIIVKFTGNSSGGAALSDAAIARGYQTWGYFYETDIGNGFETYASRWTILGMNWDASQSAWDAVKSYGKLVVGHVCASPAAYAAAITKGANIVQCSRPDLIVPVSVR